MKKHLFSTLLLMMTLCLGFIGCSDDDDNNPTESNPLVGVWKYSFGNPNKDYCLITFKADNTGNYFELDQGIVDANENFMYTYSDEDNLITVFYENGHKENIRIQWINNNSIYTDFIDDGALFTRQ